MTETNLTLRISRQLKDALATAAAQTRQTQTEYILHALAQRLDGACPTCGRDQTSAPMLPPGMSAAFERWIDELVPMKSSDSGPVTIATNEPSGARVYFGTFLGSDVYPSHVFLLPEEKGKPHFFDRIPVPRAAITMWGHHKGAELLRTRLRHSGHFDVTLSLFAGARKGR